MSMGVNNEQDKDGEQIIKDWLFGLEIKGEVIYNAEVQIGVEDRYMYVTRMSLIDFTFYVFGFMKSVII